jgi:peptidoglycan/LPS O-acetylase OafA/YrhL
MNFETMSKQRKMILIAAAVGVIAMFLPWVSISVFGLAGGSANGMHGEGILVFLCFLVAGALAWMGDQNKSLNQTNWMLTLVAGGLASLIMVIRFLSWLDILSIVSFGFYLALAASIAIVAFAYINRTAGETLQSGFDSLKNKFSNTSATTHTDVNPTTKVINPTNDPTKPVV